MATIEFDMTKLPSFEAVNTGHWPPDQQIRFAKAVQGIRSAAWFQEVFGEADEFDQERTANCFAFAAFAGLRQWIPETRPPGEDLLKDRAGLRSPA